MTTNPSPPNDRNDSPETWVDLAEAFTLREIDGMSTEELCKELDISPTNSWTMLYRARMQLRRCLEVNWINGEGKE